MRTEFLEITMQNSAGAARSATTFAVFDLDGTITYGDTFVPFVFGFLLRRPRIRAALFTLPFACLLFALRRISAACLKEHFWRACIGDAPLDQVQEWADRFARKTVAENCRPEVLGRLRRYQGEGAQVVLLSASPDIYVRAIGQELGITGIIATRFEARDHAFTGRVIGENCSGKEKVRRLEEYLADEDVHTVHAYGNAKSDLPVLRAADSGWMVQRGEIVGVRHYRPASLRPAAAVMLILGCCSFALNFGIERGYAASGLFQTTDLIFDADPSEYSWIFATGGGSIARGYRHPNLSNFLNPPVRLTAAMTSFATGISQDRVRKVLSDAVGPGFRALGVMITFATLLMLGIPFAYGVLLSLLNLVSLSGLVFGSMPESFPISSGIIAVLFGLAVESIRNGGHFRTLLWIVAGAFAVGVTITNLAPVAAAVFASQWKSRGEWRAAAWRTAKVCGAVLLMNAAVYALISPLYPSFRKKPGEILFSRDEPNFLHVRAAETMREFPLAVADTIAGPQPTHAYEPFNGKIAYGYKDAPRDSVRAWLLLIGVAVLLALGIRGWLTEKETALARIGLLAASLIVFSFGLHFVFRSSDLYVYSLHWHQALLIICAGIFIPRSAQRPWCAAAFIAALVPLAWNNYQVMEFILRTGR